MNQTHDIARQAEAAWQLGLLEEQAGRLEAAFEHFRQAHDLVVDCPRLHQKAHQHLRRLNTRRQAWRDWLTDVFLLGLAPVGVFELVAWLMKRQVLGGEWCARGARTQA